MKIFKLKCTSCGATLETEERIMYCAYCGEKLLLDDGTENINFTYRKFDEAHIRDSERKERIRLKELENEEKGKVREHIITFVLLIFLMGGPFFIGESAKGNANEVKIPSSSKEYKGDNYKQVMQELKDAGFTDIEAVSQNDLVIGLVTKDGSIERISIDGDTDFSDGDVFSKDSRVVITYHTFKTEKGEN